jgi:hypothetical protein
MKRALQVRTGRALQGYAYGIRELLTSPWERCYRDKRMRSSSSLFNKISVSFTRNQINVEKILPLCHIAYQIIWRTTAKEAGTS